MDDSIQNACAEVQEIADRSGVGFIDVGESIERRLMAQIIRQLRPTKVLEIGTFLGWTSAAIGLLLKQTHESDGFHLTSVDVIDVDSPVNGYWKNLGYIHSPSVLFGRLGLDRNIELVQADSAEYLATTEDTFDFIFIDGHHGADSVYRDIVLSSKRLKAGGVIALHDYDPPEVWFRKPFMAGPFFAVRRILAANPELKLIDARLNSDGNVVRSSCIAILSAK
ncbi:MAG: class I SAM-dependent methyltransferase [Gammaproteobacteria bacterium]|nr:class I SAM-dependent methyltransferase [Gammaproteobacteria bacterium]